MIIPYGKAICYSGYREGQSPIHRRYPNDNQILEDLRILEKDFDYIRMYDSSDYTLRTLEIIKKFNIKLKVLLTMNLLGEIYNPNCSWGGKYTVEEISRNIENNQKELQSIIAYANDYKDIVLAVSAGNESVPLWNDNLVSPGRILYFVNTLKESTNVPVTYCDNIHCWKSDLKEVAQAVDFISVHLYPVWEGKFLPEAITSVENSFNEVQGLYPEKEIIITETGWPTASNHYQIPDYLANEKNQKVFNTVIDSWAERKKVTCFFFEAFDETWKGSEDINEPEKHWGFYNVYRQPKLIARQN
jgi:exo-beta-1,3-glucanase (GH17 family)